MRGARAAARVAAVALRIVNACASADGPAGAAAARGGAAGATARGPVDHSRSLDGGVAADATAGGAMDGGVFDVAERLERLEQLVAQLVGR